MRLAHVSLLLALTLGTGGLVTGCLSSDAGQDFEAYPVAPGAGGVGHGTAQIGQPGGSVPDGGPGPDGGFAPDGGLGPDGSGNLDANVGMDAGMGTVADGPGVPDASP